MNVVKGAQTDEKNGVRPSQGTAAEARE